MTRCLGLPFMDRGLAELQHTQPLYKFLPVLAIFDLFAFRSPSYQKALQQKKCIARSALRRACIPAGVPVTQL